MPSTVKSLTTIYYLYSAVTQSFIQTGIGTLDLTYFDGTPDPPDAGVSINVRRRRDILAIPATAGMDAHYKRIILYVIHHSDVA